MTMILNGNIIFFAFLSLLSPLTYSAMYYMVHIAIFYTGFLQQNTHLDYIENAQPWSWYWILTPSHKHMFPKLLPQDSAEKQARG